MIELREWRKAHGIRQKELAERLGVSRGYIYQIERGARGFSVKLGLEIQEITGLDALAYLARRARESA